MAESDLNGNLSAEYIFFNGMRVARRDISSQVVHYYFDDQLGTARNAITPVTSNTVTFDEDADYYPYGGEIVVSGSSAATRYKFTGKERDTESNLDMFGARYYGSSLGRFMTPDWSEVPDSVPYADFKNPQSFNLYGYLQNNPMSRRDADGHVTCDPDTATWGPNGVTVTAGACHLDALDYLQLSYYSSQAWVRFQQQQAARSLHALALALKNLDPTLERALGVGCQCNDGDDQEGDKNSSNQKRSSMEKEASASRMTNKEAREAAKKLGYDWEVKDPGFDSHGNKVFTDGKNYITADRDMHSGGAWKMYDSSGNRLGTYDANLNRIGN